MYFVLNFRIGKYREIVLNLYFAYLWGVQQKGERIEEEVLEFCRYILVPYL